MLGGWRFPNSPAYDEAQFYRNGMNWGSRGLGTSARVFTDISAARIWLQGRGYTNFTLRSDWENGLTNADVLVTYVSAPSAAKQAAATNFLVTVN